MTFSELEEQRMKKQLDLHFNLLDECIVGIRKSCENMQITREFIKLKHLDKWKQVNDEVMLFKTQKGQLCDYIECLTKSAFPDMIDQPEPYCQRGIELVERLTEVNQYSLKILIESADREKQLLVAEFHFPGRAHDRLEYMLEQLKAAVSPYHDISADRRIARLNTVLDDLYLSAHESDVIDNDHRLRTLCRLMHNDKELPSEHYDALSERLVAKISEATCYLYISQNEMYSLIMLLLSDDLNTSVRKRITEELRKKLRSIHIPWDVKIDYYAVSIEMLDIHCYDEGKKQDVLTLLLSEVEADLAQFESYKDPTSIAGGLFSLSQVRENGENRSERSRNKQASGSFKKNLETIQEEIVNTKASKNNTHLSLEALKVLMCIRLEGCTIKNAPAERIENVLYKHIDRLDKILPGGNLTVSKVKSKLKIMLTADILALTLTDLWDKRCGRFFIEWFFTEPVRAQKQDFVKKVWIESFEVDDLEAIANQIQRYLNQDEEPTYEAFDDLIERAINNMSSDSVHKSFT